MTNEFWVITSFFNPAKFNALLQNYFIFSNELKRQNVNLLTVECSFDGEYQIPENNNVIRLSSNSIMWQKERLINYGVSHLPKECKYYAWIDCDIIFTNDNWVNLAIEKLQTNNIIQLFKKVIYLPPEKIKFDGEKMSQVQGVVWQKIIHKNWLQRRKNKNLPFSAPGFAWACQRHFFDDLGGIYDKNIVGSGDTFLVDCYFDSWEIHGFAKKFTEPMKKHMMNWCKQLRSKNPKIDYIPVDIWHLYHGSLKNRRYMDRHDVILNHNFDPMTDIRLENNVYEWNSNKSEMHYEIKQYFNNRKEDEKEET